MEFILKKILSAFLMPLSVGLILFLIGLFYLYSKNHKKAKLYLSISFLWIFIIAYSPFSNKILQPLESIYPKIGNNISAKYILLLGGHFEGRAYEVLRLYNLIEGSKIITSGYPGGALHSEALKNANRLIELGIPKDDIFMQDEPKDTQEEAQSIKKIVGNEPFIMVTSAAHMPRAMTLFKKEGLNPMAAPANFLVKKHDSMSLPNGSNLIKTEIAFHEYIGSIWNKLKQFKKKMINKVDEQ